MFNKERFKAYLAEAGMSYQAFGELVGVSEPMVSYLARGVKQPSIQLFGRICEATGLSADELIVK